MACYTVENLTFSYPESKRNALENVSISFGDGEYIAICGKSGSGKTTLLRHLKPVLTPYGKTSGEIRFNGNAIKDLSEAQQAEKIGYVMQSPDNQIVTDKVWHELAFGLENLGFPKEMIRLRVGEMASYFGIDSWFEKSTAELSGGEKQLVNLASVMVMNPDVLILDEPTAQLDPIAANEFLSTIRKINEEMGTTIIITEHRLEDVLSAADRAVVMDSGRIIADASPYEAGKILKEQKHDMFIAMPAAMQIFSKTESDAENCPITVKDARLWLSEIFKEDFPIHRKLEISDGEVFKETAVKIKDIWFRYEKKSPDVLTGLSVEIPKGEIYAVLGGNGTGKTTMLKSIAGILKPYKGKITLFGKELSKLSNKELFYKNVAVLPQTPQTIFTRDTVELDLIDMLDSLDMSKEEKQKKVSDIAKTVEIEEFLQMHPYDLSGGEIQRAALAKVLLAEPKLLLLDEPTKGVDNFFKEKFAEILKKITANGGTVVLVSHDIEFCAKHADECALFFNGEIITHNTSRKFFTDNNFYTTAANKLSRHVFENAVTVEDVVKLCEMNRKQQD